MSTHKSELLLASDMYLRELEDKLIELQIEYDRVQRLKDVYLTAYTDVQIRRVDDELVKEKKGRRKSTFHVSNYSTFETLRKNYRAAANKAEKEGMLDFAFEQTCRRSYSDIHNPPCYDV